MKLRAPGAALLLTLILTACDSAEPMSPDDTAGTTVRFSSSGGGVALPIPSTNTNEAGFGSYGALPEMDAGIIEAGKWVDVRVIGAIAVSTNPALLACDSSVVLPYDGANIGPLGTTSINKQLAVSMRAAGRSLILEIDGDSSQARVRFPMYSDTNTTIKATRSGLLGSRSCGGQTYPNYALAGSQTVEIEQLPEPAVIATETVLPQADTVEFIAANVPTGLSPVWWFRTGDTLSTPWGGTSGTSITACQGQTSCSYPVTNSGRMYVRYSNGLAGLVSYASDVVWVGNIPAAELRVSCEPTSVPFGDETHCVAASSDAGESPQVHQWFWLTGEAGKSGVCSQDIHCRATVTDTATIYVRATVAGVVQLASQAITVEPPQLRVEYSPPGPKLPGTQTTFTAVSPSAGLSVVGWSWAPNAGSPNTTIGCYAPTNPCTATVYNHGYMRVAADVDGVRMTAQSDLVLVGSPCPVDGSPGCDGLQDALDNLRNHSNAVCAGLGESGNQMLIAGMIYKLAQDEFELHIRGHAFENENGAGIEIASHLFGSDDLQAIVAHEIAHTAGYDHEDVNPTAPLSTGDIELICG